MRTIEQTGQFKRDYRQALKGTHRESLEEDFVTVVGSLAADRPMPEKNHDHELIGNWKTFVIAISNPTLY
jgi:mRNA interferase YafQ